MMRPSDTRLHIIKFRAVSSAALVLILLTVLGSMALSSADSRVVGAGLRGRVLDDAAQAKPLAGPRVHDEGVVAELALRVQAACMQVRILSVLGALAVSSVRCSA